MGRRDREGTARLPVEDIGDVELAARSEGEGCPLCRLRLDAAERSLRAILWESVNDVGFRRRLEQGRGFCSRHARELLAADREQSGGSTGAAVLLAASIRYRTRELDALLDGERRRMPRQVANAARRPDCPVCDRLAARQASALGRIATLLSDGAWRSAIAHAELCLDDLLALWAVAAGREGWSEVARAQVRRARDLAERLESFAHHSSYDRRHLMTADERAASDEAAAFFGDAELAYPAPFGDRGAAFVRLLRRALAAR